METSSGSGSRVVLFGIDRFLREQTTRAPLRGRRIALLAHRGSVTADLVHSLDALRALPDPT